MKSLRFKIVWVKFLLSARVGGYLCATDIVSTLTPALPQFFPGCYRMVMTGKRQKKAYRSIRHVFVSNAPDRPPAYALSQGFISSLQTSSHALPATADA